MQFPVLQLGIRERGARTAFRLLEESVKMTHGKSRKGPQWLSLAKENIPLSFARWKKFDPENALILSGL